MTRAVQTFIPVVPTVLSHSLMEAYTYTQGKKVMAGIRKSVEAKDAEDVIRPFVERAAPSEPITGAVSETVKLCYPILTPSHVNGEPYLIKQESEGAVGIINGLCACAGWIFGDSQIWRSSITRVWSNQPGIYIRLESMSQGDAK